MDSDRQGKEEGPAKRGPSGEGTDDHLMRALPRSARGQRGVEAARWRPSFRSGDRKTLGRVSSRKLHDADPASFPWGNFRVAVVDRVIELVETLRIIAVLAPITRPREEAVFTLGCADDDPHCVAFPDFSRFCAAIAVFLKDSNYCRQLNQACRHAELTYMAWQLVASPPAGIEEDLAAA